MTAPVSIRNAVGERDAADMADLLGQLGYPCRPDEVVSRLQRIEAFGDAVAFVADVNGHAVGLVTAHVIPTIHNTTQIAWLTAMVVGRDHQQMGIGRQLVTAAEEWARSQGAPRISVGSGKQRDDAHAFYQKIGYAHSGVRFTKSLA